MVTESNNRKNLKKDAVYFEPQDNHDTTIAKNYTLHLKKLQVQTRVENDFSFQFLRGTEEVETLGEKRWGEQSYLTTSREDIREAHAILAS